MQRPSVRRVRACPWVSLEHESGSTLAKHIALSLNVVATSANSERGSNRHGLGYQLPLAPPPPKEPPPPLNELLELENELLELEESDLLESE